MATPGDAALRIAVIRGLHSAGDARAGDKGRAAELIERALVTDPGDRAARVVAGYVDLVARGAARVAGLCAYTWFAPALFQRMLARSLGTVRLDPDFRAIS